MVNPLVFMALTSGLPAFQNESFVIHLVTISHQSSNLKLFLMSEIFLNKILALQAFKILFLYIFVALKFTFY